MRDTIDELIRITEDFSVQFSALSETELSAKSVPGKWSKKEVIGHLIDSAQNNLRRFICGQYEPVPSKIVYDQDQWVTLNDYQHATSSEVIALWALMNKRIADVLKNMSPISYQKESDTGKNSISLHSLEWLADDYVSHLKHHLNQVIPNSFDITYR